MLPSDDLAPDVKVQDLWNAVEQGHRELGLRLECPIDFDSLAHRNRLFGSSLCRRAVGVLDKRPLSRRLKGAHT